MFKAIKRNVFVRVLYITNRKFKFFLKKAQPERKDHTCKVINVRSLSKL